MRRARAGCSYASRAPLHARNGHTFFACQTRFGAADGEGDQDPGPWLPAGKQAGLGRRQQPECDRGEVKGDRVFVEEGDTGDNAGRQPPARRLFGLDDAHRNDKPSQRLERVRYQQNAEELQRAARQNGGPGKPTGVEAAANEARCVHRQRDRCRRRKRRNEPKAAQAVKPGVRRPGKEGASAEAGQARCRPQM